MSYNGNENWCLLENRIELAIKSKIDRLGVPLSNWNIRINYGIKTGYNKAFIIDNTIKADLIRQDNKSADIIRPILRGRDIDRYNYNFSNLYMLYVPWHFPLQHKDINGVSEEAEMAFKKEYPAVYHHLLKYKSKLSERNKAETGIRYEWYALQRWGANYSDV